MELIEIDVRFLEVLVNDSNSKCEVYSNNDLTSGYKEHDAKKGLPLSWYGPSQYKFTNGVDEYLYRLETPMFRDKSCAKLYKIENND